MFRKLISHILITAFVFLSIPKQLWHDCDHDESDHSHVAEIKFEKKCFTCDFQLAPATNPTEFTSFLFTQDYYITQESTVDLVDLVVVSRDYLRGPPKC